MKMVSRAFTFFINLFELWCSIIRCIIWYWPMFLKLPTGLWSSPVEEPLMVAIEFFCALCWILYGQNQDPVSWFLMATNLPPLISQMLYSIMLFIHYRCFRSQIRSPALHTLITLGILLLVFVVIGLLWIRDVVSHSCLGISAIVTEVLSSILIDVQLWHNPIPDDWTIIPQSIFGLVSGAIGLFMFTLQHNKICLINSVVVLIFGLVHLGVAFFVHKSHSVPWFSHGTSYPPPSGSAIPN